MESCLADLELELAEPFSGQLAGVVLALVRAGVRKEEAVAVKIKGRIQVSFKWLFY